jgi:hypothetical protein
MAFAFRYLTPSSMFLWVLSTLNTSANRAIGRHQCPHHVPQAKPQTNLCTSLNSRNVHGRRFSSLSLPSVKLKFHSCTFTWYNTMSSMLVVLRFHVEETSPQRFRVWELGRGYKPFSTPNRDHLRARNEAERRGEDALVPRRRASQTDDPMVAWSMTLIGGKDYGADDVDDLGFSMAALGLAVAGNVVRTQRQ